MFHVISYDEYNFLCMHIMVKGDKKKRRALQRTE